MFRKIVGKLQPPLYQLIKWHYRKPRWLVKRGIKIYLQPTVFHPSLYLSTDVFLDYLLRLSLGGQAVLELGAGNGFISLYLAKHLNCSVTASDINARAIVGLRASASANGVDLQLVCSDLFDHISATHFDTILINPPYYARVVTQVAEHAFFCGSDFEYFRKLYPQLLPHLRRNATVLVILSMTAPFAALRDIAQQHDVEWVEVHRRRKMREWFLIYQLRLINPSTP